MTCMSRPRPTTDARHSQPNPIALVLRRIRAGWRAYWDWRARKATILLLRSLDERTLHDIGIRPSEIESLVHGPCNDDRRRRYDPAWHHATACSASHPARASVVTPPIRGRRPAGQAIAEHRACDRIPLPLVGRG